MTLKQTLHHLNLRNTKLLPKLNKSSKIILTICLIFCLSLSLKSIFAITKTIDTTNTTQEYNAKEAAIDKGNNQEAWIYESTVSNLVAAKKGLAGNLDLGVTDSKGNPALNWNPGGLIGFTNQSIASLYNPPASGVQYIADSVNSFLGKPAYAAEDSFGFNRLKGILDIWKTMRNTVYTLISLFFVITGIMIMLRVKLSPQATVTIQSAIPGIISSMVLVTFSYAIAGLMIDLSYLFMGVVLNIISKPFDTSLMNMDFWGFGTYLGTNVVSVGSIMATTGIVGLISGVILWFAATPVIGVLAFALGLVIIFIIILIQLIKFFFGLAKCYIMLLIHIILGPLEIGMGAIPGSKINFSSWFNEILSNIAVFPISVIFLALMSAIIKACQGGDIWAPPILGNGNHIAFILGLASLFILSKLPELIPQVVFNIKPSPIGKALSDGFKEGFSDPIKKIKSSDYYRQGMDYTGHKMLQKGMMPRNNFDRAVGWVGKHVREKYTKH
jgi:cell division protein FtsL